MPLLLGVRHDHLALARRELLVRIEGEDARGAVGAEGSTAILRSERLAGVVDQRKPVPVGDGVQLVELARVAVDVDGDDRLRPLGHRGLDGGGIEIERPPVDVREDGSPALVEEAVRARGERVRRRDDLITRPDPGRDAEQMQACGARGDGRCVGGADALGQELLEAVDRRPEREPARAQHLEDQLLLALAEVRPRKRDRRHFLLHACSM